MKFSNTSPLPHPQPPSLSNTQIWELIPGKHKLAQMGEIANSGDQLSLQPCIQELHSVPVFRANHSRPRAEILACGRDLCWHQLHSSPVRQQRLHVNLRLLVPTVSKCILAKKRKEISCFQLKLLCEDLHNVLRLM